VSEARIWPLTLQPLRTHAAMKLMSVTREHAEKHYADLKDKPFFGGLCEYSACPAQGKWLRLPQAQAPPLCPSPPL
jgi:hypothetical protein